MFFLSCPRIHTFDSLDNRHAKNSEEQKSKYKTGTNTV